jgi:threonine dehydratase
MKAVTRPTLEEIREAANRIRGIIVRTPLVPLHRPDQQGDILLKPEMHQPVASFKLRGIFNAVARLTDEERRRGLSTVSAGNTAQALAWAARYFGIPARSLMPDTAPRSKIAAVRAYGATPVLVPVQELFRYLREHGWESESYTFIHPWTDRNVMTGHGSIGLEIMADCPDVDSVFVSVGGGGLIAGVASAVKALRPKVKVVAVEPEGCPSLHASFEAGGPASVACHTICDGVAVPYITGEMYPLLRELVDDVVLVTEDGVRRAIRRLALEDKIVAEGAGALPVAAALAMPKEKRGRSIAVVSGGNIDRDLLTDILSDRTLDADAVGTASE